MQTACVLFLGLLQCLLTSVHCRSEYRIEASVLGYPGSHDAEVYKHIADVLLEEDQSGADNYCSINFTPLTFDTTDGATVYDSLKTARENFQFKPVAVAVGPFIDVFASTDYVIVKQLHLLTSPAGENAGLMDPRKVVSVLPEPQSMARAIADVIKRLNWKNVALLAQDITIATISTDFTNSQLFVRSVKLDEDKHTAIFQFHFLTRLYSQQDIHVWPIRLPTHITSHEDNELRRNLIELRASAKDKFILHSTRRDIVQHVMLAKLTRLPNVVSRIPLCHLSLENIIQAKHLHLLHHSIDWFVTYPDFEDVVQSREAGSVSWPGSLYGLQLLRQDKIPHKIANLSEERNMSRLDLGLARDVVGLLRHVLWRGAGNCSRPPFSDSYITADIFQTLLKDKAVTYSGALGEYVWEAGDNARTNYTMDILALRDTDMSTIGRVDFTAGQPNVTIFEEPGTTAAPEKVFGDDDVLRIATKQDDPFIIKRGENNYTGFSYDLLEKLSKRLNFRFQLFDITERERLMGSSDGMVHELVTGNASMAVGALEVTAERETKISFSYTILSTQASVLVKKAKSTHNFFQWLSPFKTDLWMMIIAFIGVAAAALFLISRFDPTQQGAEQRFDLKESVWYAINILLQGSTEYSPQTTSMRAIIAFFWFSVIIIEAAYTANLAAYLTLQQIDNRIKTVHDLAGQTVIKYGVENNSNLMHFFREQMEDPFERMWAFMKINEETSLLSNTTEILEKVNTGGFAYIADGVTNDYYASQYCGIEAIDQNFGAKDFGFGFPRGAPYRDDINRALLKLKEEGELDDLKRKWWSAGLNCTEDDETRSVSDKTTAELDITNMVGVFIVLAAFTFVAIVVDIADKLHGRKKAKEKENSVIVTADEVIANNYTANYS